MNLFNEIVKKKIISILWEHYQKKPRAESNTEPARSLRYQSAHFEPSRYTKTTFLKDTWVHIKLCHQRSFSRSDTPRIDYHETPVTLRSIFPDTTRIRPYYLNGALSYRASILEAA